jgi:crotonobetainyl-CoA:carnitine CoA-transferase CaiB-like acyl-CoA transferase
VPTTSERDADAPEAGAQADARPLAGVRVLDLSRLLPGPVCTLYLADLGADVIKVEDTGAGDYARSLGARAGGASAFYRAVNRNKRSVAVDLKDTRGREAFLVMARSADVVLESFRPGVVDALGIGYAALAAANPRIVLASISGYGQDGPRAAMAGHDINYLGYAGILDQTGVAGGAPALCNLQIADLLGGAASAAVAILASLVRAQKSGRGARIDVAMADAALAHNIFSLHALAQWGATRPRGEDLLTGGVPAYGVYGTSDGRWLAVGALEDKFWRVFCATIGRDDLAGLGLATGEEGRRARREIEAVFASHRLSHWKRVFADVDCCVTPVLTLDEALTDAQFVARGMVIESEGMRAFAPPFRIDGLPFGVARGAPAQGEHSVEVLREAGLGAPAIEALVSAGVVRVAGEAAAR